MAVEGIEVAGKNGCRNYLGRNAFYLFLLKFGGYGRMVFEPLCIFRKFGGTPVAAKSLKLTIHSHEAFDAQGVAIAFSEIADKVDKAFGVLEPVNGVIAESADVARATFDEQVDDLLLGGGVGKRTCLFKYSRLRAPERANTCRQCAIRVR